MRIVVIIIAFAHFIVYMLNKPSEHELRIAEMQRQRVELGIDVEVDHVNFNSIR